MTAAEGTPAKGLSVRLVIDRSTETDVETWLRAVILEAPWMGHSSPYPVQTEDGGVIARWNVKNTAARGLHFWLAAIEDAIVRMIETGVQIRHATVIREGHGARRLPSLPIVGSRTHLVVTDEDRLAEAYGNAQAMISAGSWGVKEVAGRLVLSRAMHAETNVDLLAAVWDSHWAMARLVKPGLADYGQFFPPIPEEEAITSASSATIEQINYDPERETLTYASRLEPGQHVRGWEILALRDLLYAHRLPDGARLERIEVIFPDEDTARREIGPLRDIGVAVGYDATSEPRFLTGTEGKLASCIDVRLVIEGSSVTEVATRVFDAISHEPWPEVKSWASPIETDGRHEPIGPILRAKKLPDPNYVEWRLPGPSAFYIEIEDGELFAKWRIYDLKEEENTWRWLAATEEVIVRLLRSGLQIGRGIVSREGDGVACLPWLPVAGEGTTYISVTTEAAIAEGFEDVPSMISEGNWEVKALHGHMLLSRAMHAETNVELLEAIWDSHWAMARLVKPGLANYKHIYPSTKEEMPIVNAGGATIEPVGYDPDRKTLIYSSVLEPGQHVRGWEILSLRKAVLAKKLPDGRAVERIEVIFPDEEMARDEMRPLRDIGVEVGYYADNGQRTYLP
jgi:hypothetical protein